MTLTKKTFNESHYNNDDNAKELFIRWLEAKGWNAYVNPDKYGIDVLATDLKGTFHQFEVEVKHNWKGPKFQYDTLHYSGRKQKFLNNPTNTSFVTINHNRTHALIAPGIILTNAPIIVKNTIYTKNEQFIEVKSKDCTLIVLEVTNDN
jgi:hypothetical protein